jgi:hypothetical protein
MMKIKACKANFGVAEVKLVQLKPVLSNSFRGCRLTNSELRFQPVWRLGKEKVK